MRDSIVLKFGTEKEQYNVNSRTKFTMNMVHILGDMEVYLPKNQTLVMARE